MAEETEFPQIPEQSGRPQGLTVVCILSFIGAGLSAVSNIFFFLFHAQVIQIIESGVYKEMGFDMTMIQGIGRNYFLWTGLLQLIAFQGVIQLWLMKRIGFHIYTISQILMLIVSSVYIYRPSGVFPAFDLVFTGTFVLIYFRYFNQMK
jgi:hypothetical protein